MKKWYAAAAIAAVSIAAPAFAADSAALEVGTGNKTQFIRARAQWLWDKQWFSTGGRHLGGYWDATLMQMRGNAYQGRDATQNITVIGITPVFRWQSDTRKGFYAEGGIGAHYFSSIYDNNNRSFSTNFQFGDHLGVGVVTNDGWDIGLKIQHYSNGGYKHPNPGANFVVLKAGKTF